MAEISISTGLLLFLRVLAAEKDKPRPELALDYHVFKEIFIIFTFGHLLPPT
jgi:hypothetical protein